jgi:hypothetical protein
MIVIPHEIDFVDWASTLVIDLPRLTIPVVSSVNEWKSWALFLLEENRLVNIPNPYQFSDWRDWANYFVSFM